MRAWVWEGRIRRTLIVDVVRDEEERGEDIRGGYKVPVNGAMTATLATGHKNKGIMSPHWPPRLLLPHVTVTLERFVSKNGFKAQR
jgi:hypothetical protein